MKVRWLAALLLVAVSAVAAAQVASLFSVGIDNAFLGISTSRLPRGWFNAAGGTDRSKTDLQTSYSFDATTCSPAASGATVHSLTTGNLTTFTNTSGNVVGYAWDTTVDLSSFQNHWYEHLHCDGTTEVHGCPEARPVQVISTAVDKEGTCRRYDGTSTCVYETALLSLPSVQDPTVVDTQCGDSCGIGPCVSECEHTCDSQFPGKELMDQRKACKERCVCTCKLSRPSGCPQPDNCD